MTTATHAKGHRFQIKISDLSQLLLLPFGVSRKRAVAQLHDGELHVQFGPMFDERIPVANIEEAGRARWPRWAGVGPRSNFRGSVGLVGSYADVVRLTLKEPLDVHLFLFPLKCRRLYISFEDPARFLKELGKAPEEETAKAA